MSEETGINFELAWEQAPINEPLLAAELARYRNHFYSKNLIGVDAQGIGFGNISVRVCAGNTFLISGAGTGRQAEFGQKQIAFVTGYDLRGNSVACRGLVKASSESLSHAALYEGSPRVRGVVHVHHAEVWSAGAPGLHTTQKAAPYGSPELAEELRDFARGFEGECAVLRMSGHQDGLIAFGSSLQQAASCMLELIDRSGR